MRPASNHKLQLITLRMNLLNRSFHPTNILFRKLIEFCPAVKRIVVHNKSSSLFSSDQKVNAHTCLLKISHVLCSLMCSLIWFLSCLFFPESCYGNVASLYVCMCLPICKLSKRSLQFFLAEAGLQKIFEFFLNSKAALG